RAEREDLCRELHRRAAEVDAWAEAEGERATGAELPLASVLQRHRVADPSAQRDSIAGVGVHHTERAAAEDAFCVTEGHATTEGGRVIGESERAANMNRSAAERQITLAGLRGCRGREQCDARHRASE